MHRTLSKKPQAALKEKLSSTLSVFKSAAAANYDEDSTQNDERSVQSTKSIPEAPDHVVKVDIKQKLVPSRPSLFFNIKPSFRPRLTPAPPIVNPQRPVSQQRPQAQHNRPQQQHSQQQEDTLSQRLTARIAATVDEAAFAQDDSIRRLDDCEQPQLRVLLADESIVCTKLLQHLLDKVDGCSIVVARSTIALLEAAESTAFELVIMDVFMSAEDGSSILPDLRSAMTTPTPVILSSSCASLKGEAMRRGADAFLCSPTTARDLKGLLATTQRGHKAAVSKVLVESAVFFKTTYVMVGACSDSLLRIWDVATGQVLCACPTEEIAGKGVGQTPQAGLSSGALQTIKASANEVTLVGAYNDGIIRVWEVIHSSIDTLRSALYSKIEKSGDGELLKNIHNSNMKNRYVCVASNTKGMAVAPLNLIAEWRAHDAQILSLSLVSMADFTARAPSKRFDVNEDPGAFEKDEFVLSAGIDQEVYLWNLWGKLVGIFGTDDWDVDSTNTFREHEVSFRDKMRNPAQLQPNPPECAPSNPKPDSASGSKKYKGIRNMNQILTKHTQTSTLCFNPKSKRYPRRCSIEQS